MGDGADHSATFDSNSMDANTTIRTESSLQKDPQIKKPVPLRLTGLMLVLMAVQVGTLWRSARLSQDLASIVYLPMALDFVASVLWVLVFGGVVWALWRGWPKAQRAAGLAGIGFVLYSVARLMVFTQAAYDKQRLPFLLLLGGVFVVLFWVTLLRKNGDVSNGNNARS